MTAFRPWKVLHCDLSGCLPSIELDPQYEGVLVVLWWRDIPLGQFDVRGSRLPMPAAILASHIAEAIAPAVGRYVLRGKHGRTVDNAGEPADFGTLAVLENPLARMKHVPTANNASTTVSVVVCTHNRPRTLERCLASLNQLNPAPQEILLVDNDPDSAGATRGIAASSGVRYVPEPRVGLSIARNTGIRNSQGDIVAFTDDDASVHPRWIAELRSAFDDDRVMAVTGLVLPAELDTEAQWIFEKVHGGFNLGYLPRSFDAGFYKGTRDRGVPAWSIGAGANMAIRRQAFEKVGDFHEMLGAGAAGCSEDSEFWYRLVAEGWTCRYEPRAVVFHSHRRDMAELRSQYYRYMRGHVCALFVQYARYGDRGNLHRAFVALPRYYTKLLWRMLRRRDLRRRGTICAEIGGWFTGIVRYGRMLLMGNRRVNPASVNGPDEIIP